MAQSSHDAMGSPTIAISPPVHGSVLHTTDTDYDVFLSHRGPDVKDGFISHLHEALRTAGLNPFLDKASCRKGHPAFSSIDDALEVATVFSLTFRSSPQLEDELLFNWEYPRYWPIFIEEFEEFDVKPTIFSYNELRIATRDFSEDMKLGQGGYGAVYKGVLPNGNVVAVKQLYVKTAQGMDDFLNEVVLITGMKHRNLVNLKGCCLREHQRLLVYEYVDNYDVDHVLTGSKREELSWPMRLKICLGVARGLHYLHALAHPRVIHRDIKAGNVLLDSNMEPKIADFGLALLFPDEQSHIMTVHVAGTKGYLAPEYASLGQLSDKVDVYSFGVLCLEIISGRKNIQLVCELLFNWEYPRRRLMPGPYIEVVWDRDEDLENEDLTPEQETWRQMEWPKVPLDSSTALSNSEVPLDSILQELASGIAGLPHPVGKRSLRKGETWMPDEVVDNNEKLMSTLAPFFKKHVENALEPILGPVASILRSQGEEEWKHQETLFALEERQLALRSEKIQLKRRRLGLSQRKWRSSSTKPLRPRIQLEHRLKFPRVH